MYFADKALSINIQYTEAYCEKAFCLIEEGKNKQAIEVLETGISYNPNYWRSYYMLGNAYSNLGNGKKALANYYQASKLNRGNLLPSLYRNIGLFYSDLGFKEQAEIKIKQCLELTGNSLAYLSDMSWLEFHFGAHEASRSYSEELLARIPDSEWTLFKLAFSNMFLGRIEESLPYFRQLEEMYDEGPAWETSPHRLAWVYDQLGLHKKAEEYFNKRIQTITEYLDSGQALPTDYYDLAGVQAYRGETDQALENLRLAFQEDDFSHDFQLISRWIEFDPLFDELRNNPEFTQIVSGAQAKYDKMQRQVRDWLRENGLLESDYSV